jgi:tryptophan-rich sensory protein
MTVSTIPVVMIIFVSIVFSSSVWFNQGKKTNHRPKEVMFSPPVWVVDKIESICTVTAQAAFLISRKE